MVSYRGVNRRTCYVRNGCNEELVNGQTVKATDACTAWRVLEPYHAMIYFAPEAREAYASAGLKGDWMGYFASRAAPLGVVPASFVTTTFFNFHTRMVARAIPDAESDGGNGALDPAKRREKL